MESLGEKWEMKFDFSICPGWVSKPESADGKALRAPSPGPGTAQEGASSIGETTLIQLTEKSRLMDLSCFQVS